MFASLEKVGKVQRFDRHSSEEELELEATVGQKNGQINEDVASLEQNKINCRLECDTHKTV
jgi:hypothetical protein